MNRYMRYEPSSYGPPSLSSNYQMSPFGGGDSYRPDRDRDRDMPPSPGGHLSYYERDRLDDRDYYGRGPPRGGSGNVTGGPMSDYDRYRVGSGRGRPTWGPKDDSNRRLLDRDRPERISTNNADTTRSGKTSPTSYSATSTPTKERLPIPAAFDIVKPDESKKEVAVVSETPAQPQVDEKDITSKIYIYS